MQLEVPLFVFRFSYCKLYTMSSVSGFEDIHEAQPDDDLLIDAIIIAAWGRYGRNCMTYCLV